MTLAAGSARGLALAAFCAGLAAGLRSQVVVAHGAAADRAQGIRAQGSGLKRDRAASILRLRSLIPDRGRVSRRCRSVVRAAGRSSAAGRRPTGTRCSIRAPRISATSRCCGPRHGARDVRDALYYAFVAPWAAWPVAAVVLRARVRRPGAPRTPARRDARRCSRSRSVPYLVFDLLFQETFTSRYALPLVVPMAYLAVAGLRLLPWDIGLAVAVALAMFWRARRRHLDRRLLARRRRRRSGCSTTMQAPRPSTSSQPPVLAPDRRESFDLRGPRKWLGDAIAARRGRRCRRRRSTSGWRR